VNEDPTKELPGGTPFEQQVLAQLSALRSEVGSIRSEVGSIRSEVGSLRKEVAEIRAQQVAMAKNIAALDQRLTSLEETVDSRLKETRPIWEAVQSQLKKLDEKFTLFIRDLYDVRVTFHFTTSDSA
jgi:predicted  nucleic acid-binding Zn-ribbon protein